MRRLPSDLSDLSELSDPKKDAKTRHSAIAPTTEGRFKNVPFRHYASRIAACAAARRAIGTRKGLHET